MKNLNLMLLAALAILPSMAFADISADVQSTCAATTPGNNCPSYQIDCGDHINLISVPPHDISACTTDCAPNATMQALAIKFCKNKGGKAKIVCSAKSAGVSKHSAVCAAASAAPALS